MKTATRAVLAAVFAAVLTAAAPRASTSPPRVRKVVRASELVPGPGSTGRIGDYRLDNGVVTAIVDGLGQGQGAAESGGNLVDLAPAGGQDYLFQVFLFLNETFPRQAIYRQISTSSSASEASVRVRGHDSADPTILIETEYVLRARASYLLLRTTVENRGPKALAGFGLGDVVQWGHAERFLPGQGQRARGTLKVPWGAGAGRTSSFLYAAASGPLGGIHGGTWSDFVVTKPDIAPGQRVTFERFIAIGRRPDYSSALDVAWPLMGGGALGTLALGTLEGTVLEAGTGRPLPATVIVLQNDGPVTTIAADGDGRFSAQLPEGAYRVTILSRDRASPRAPAEVRISASRTETLRLEATRPGALHVTFAEGKAPCAGKLVLEGIDGTLDPDLGPTYAAAGAANTAVTHDGKLRLVLPPGRYRATCARGIEFDVDVRDIDVTPQAPGGDPTRLACEMRRAVETPGRLALDLHQHAVPSYDAAVSLEDRVVANLAEGLEGFVASDHNVITDYAAAVRKLGVGKRILAITGNEATAEGLGHFNAYPLVARPRAPRGGAPEVRGRQAPDIFADLRRLGGGDKVIQVNHPRAGREGFFDRIKFDPRTPGYPAGWAADFDAIEVVNGKRAAEIEPVLRDWFELLRRGKVVTAVGNSDTHAVFGTEAGYPRNLIAVGSDDPAGVTADDVVRAIKRRRDVVVTNGPILSPSIGGAGPGGRAPAPVDPARTPVQVRVEAAPWVDVDRIEIYVDGVPATAPIAVPPSRQRLRVDRAIPVATRPGSSVAVVARGSLPLHPVVSNMDKQPIKPFAVANPIWIGAPSKRKPDTGAPRK